MKREPKSLVLVTALAAVAALLAAGLTAWSLPEVLAAPAGGGGPPSEALAWGLVGAALATGLSALGAGLAVGKLGAAAVATLAERPELFGRLLIFVGLAEGIAIYGLIVSILILNRLA